MITVLLPDLRGGGAERVMLDLAREFATSGHEVEFALLRGEGDFLAETQRDFAVTSLGVARTRSLPLQLPGYLRRRKPKAVIANMWPLTSAAVVGRAASRHRCRLLLVEHNTLSRQYASWGRMHAGAMSASMRGTYRFADVVAAVSIGSAADTARLAGLAGDRVEVLYNPIPPRTMSQAEARATADAFWNCPPGRRILTVGSLKDQKNHALLLSSLAHLARPDTKLLILGQGENETMLRAQAIELGIGGQVIFAGFHADPSPFYATADLFVLSSDYEGFGNVIVEALSFGLPVVSTDCPSGPAEILEQGRFGTLVPVGNIDALARALALALDTPVDRVALQRRAADFAPAIAARRYLDLLGLS